jgi:hypothetical protein
MSTRQDTTGTHKLRKTEIPEDIKPPKKRCSYIPDHHIHLADNDKLKWAKIKSTYKSMTLEQLHEAHDFVSSLIPKQSQGEKLVLIQLGLDIRVQILEKTEPY